MDTWLLWKLIKYLGLMLFSGSLGIALFCSHNRRLQWKALTWGVGSGFFLLWIGGYGMLKATGFRLSSFWVGYGQFFSIACIWFAFLRISGKKAALSVSLSLLSIALAVAAMILKEAVLPLLRSGAALMLLGGGSLLIQKAGSGREEATELSWFRLVAWLEGLSLIVLLFLYVPLKYLASVNLDQGQGWFGWVHGVLQIMFIQALLGLRSVNRVSIPQVFTGIAASVLPFGSMIFERKMRSGS